jgi:hypothetical protein
MAKIIEPRKQVKDSKTGEFFWQAATLECDCGEKVDLHTNFNECECGACYTNYGNRTI